MLYPMILLCQESWLLVQYFYSHKCYNPSTFAVLAMSDLNAVCVATADSATKLLNVG